MILSLTSVLAETIIIDGGNDEQVNDSLPSDEIIVDNETGEIIINGTDSEFVITASDFDNLVGLTEALIESNRILKLQNDALLAQKNASVKEISGYTTTIGELSDVNERLSDRLTTLESDIDEVEDRNLALENRISKTSAWYWVSILIVLILAVVVTRIYYIFKTRGKVYFLVKWIKSNWPFRTGPPEASEVRYRRK